MPDPTIKPTFGFFIVENDPEPNPILSSYPLVRP